MKDKLIPLHDILREVAFLKDIRDRTTYEAFKDDPADVRAASYSVLVISEAVRRIPEDWLTEHPDTPWRAIKTIGNKLRHEYQRVSEVILWGIIADHSDSLKTVIEAMMAQREKKKINPSILFKYPWVWGRALSPAYKHTFDMLPVPTSTTP